MDFRERLQKATERGQQHRDAKVREVEARAMSEDEYKRLHSENRLSLTEHIENCLQQLADNFPGFRFEEVMDEQGWGSAVSRDDVGLGGGKRDNFFSRLQMFVRPYGSHHVLELVAKGTIRNKEFYNRTTYQLLADLDLESFTETVDLWVLEYAERYAASN